MPCPFTLNVQCVHDLDSEFVKLFFKNTIRKNSDPQKFCTVRYVTVYLVESVYARTILH